MSGQTIYAYVGGDPVSFTDPSGRFAMLAPLIPIVTGITASDLLIGTGLAGALIGLDKILNENTSDTEAGSAAAGDKGDVCSWGEAKPYRGKTKTNGESGKRRRFFEWDHTHGDVEVYDGQGRHLGSANPETGQITKPPVPGRKINL